MQGLPQPKLWGVWSVTGQASSLGHHLQGSSASQPDFPRPPQAFPGTQPYETQDNMKVQVLCHWTPFPCKKLLPAQLCPSPSCLPCLHSHLPSQSIAKVTLMLGVCRPPLLRACLLGAALFLPWAGLSSRSFGFLLTGQDVPPLLSSAWCHAVCAPGWARVHMESRGPGWNCGRAASRT